MEDKKRKANSGIGKFIFFMLLPGVVFVSIFTYYPLFRGIIMAFQNFTLWDTTNIHFIGLDNFKNVLADPDFTMALKNTVIWVFVSLFFQFILGFALALLLKKSFKGRGLYQALVFTPWAISGFLIGLIWRWLFNGQTGVINDLLIRVGFIDQPIAFLATPGLSLFSVIIGNIWYGITLFAIMILAALQSIPIELYEAADIDGSSTTYKFFNITIPYIKPVLVLTTLLRVIWILNFPDLIYSMTEGGPAGSSHTLTTYMLDLLIFNQDYGKASAVGVIIILVLALYAIFYLTITKFEESGDF